MAAPQLETRDEEARAFTVLRAGEESAERLLTRPQAIVLGALAAGLIAPLALAPAPTVLAVVIALVTWSSSSWVYRLSLILIGLRHPARWAGDDGSRLSEAELPVYTLLVPLYREASVVDGLVDAIARLDYPRSKLDVKLLLEADDPETRARVEARDLASPFEVLLVPPDGPRTKPKACNHGLAHARGEYVVVYDAEDRPEPGQLRAAVAGLRASPPEVVCLQARLRYWNRDQNLLTRLFACEYAQKFDLLLPGIEHIDGPIPLGGTSNHFPTSALRALGGWDAWNVTEDLELGIRLAARGFRTGVLDSVTWEEANSRLASWVRQRSRWLKGHVQTWLVMMRRPIVMWRRLGTWRWLQANFLTLGVFLPLMQAPFLLPLAAIGALGAFGVVDPPLLPTGLYLALAAQSAITSGVYVVIHVIGARRAGLRYPGVYAAILPFYYQLVSLATWRGFLQLIRRPSYWEKTPHGLAPPPPAEVLLRR